MAAPSMRMSRRHIDEPVLPQTTAQAPPPFKVAAKNVQAAKAPITERDKLEIEASRLSTSVVTAETDAKIFAGMSLGFLGLSIFYFPLVIVSGVLAAGAGVFYLISRSEKKALGTAQDRLDEMAKAGKA